MLRRATADGVHAAEDLTHRLGKLRDPKQWSPVIREFLELAGDADRSADRLQALLEGSVAGRLRPGWQAFAVAWCRDELGYQLVRDVYDAAMLGDFELIRMLLLSGNSAQRNAKESEFQPDDQLASMTIGHRIALARKPDPMMIERLLHDGEPRVVRAVLSNPRMTEPLVIRLAARRPNRVACLDEIAKATKWILRPQVQRTLLLNPYTPTRVSMALTPLLRPRQLREVAADRHLHPGVSRLAEGCAELRMEPAPVFH